MYDGLKDEKKRGRNEEKRRWKHKKNTINRKDKFALKRLGRGNNLDKKEILRIGIKEERWKCVN